MNRCLLLVAPILLISPAAAQDLSAIGERIHQRFAESRVPGGTIAVSYGDNDIVVRAYGVRSVETQQPVDTDTLFQIGSVVKTWTAAALLKALEERQLSEHAPIGQFVSGLRPDLARLTVHQLLSHTAGLADSSSDLGTLNENALAATISDPKAYQVFSVPGRIMSYSNPGYQLAGYVLQKLTGKPYPEAVADLLLRPLGAHRTFFRPATAMTYPLALGHNLGKTGDKPTVVRPMPFSSEAMASGYVFTTAHDVALVAQTLLNNGRAKDGSQVLSANLVAKMTAPHAAMAESHGTISYGYGLFLEGSTGNRTWFHGGGLDGYNSNMVIRPDQRLVSVVIANASAGAAVDQIKNLIIGEFAPAPQKTTTKKASSLQPVPKNTAATILGRWGQGDRVFNIRYVGQQLTFSLGTHVFGTLMSDKKDRLVLKSPSGENSGYVAIVRDRTGDPEFLAWGGRAIARLPASDRT